jgi:hypothetical protein
MNKSILQIVSSTQPYKFQSLSKTSIDFPYRSIYTLLDSGFPFSDYKTTPHYRFEGPNGEEIGAQIRDIDPRYCKPLDLDAANLNRFGPCTIVVQKVYGPPPLPSETYAPNVNRPRNAPSGMASNMALSILSGLAGRGGKKSRNIKNKSNRRKSNRRKSNRRKSNRRR